MSRITKYVIFGLGFSFCNCDGKKTNLITNRNSTYSYGMTILAYSLKGKSERRCQRAFLASLLVPYLLCKSFFSIFHFSCIILKFQYKKICTYMGVCTIKNYVIFLNYIYTILICEKN